MFDKLELKKPSDKANYLLEQANVKCLNSYWWNNFFLSKIERYNRCYDAINYLNHAAIQFEYDSNWKQAADCYMIIVKLNQRLLLFNTKQCNRIDIDISNFANKANACNNLYNELKSAQTIQSN